MKYLLIEWLRKLRYSYNCRNFDREYYLEKYPDVAMSGIDPLVHYKKHGWKEGRYSSLRDEIENKMDCMAYLKLYPDVKKSGMDPVMHYLRHGQHEGRKFKSIINSDNVSAKELDIIIKSPYWDESWYLSYYQLDKQANVNPAMQYLGSAGRSRNPGPFFNSMEYLLLNPDVGARGVNPLLHYEMFGWKEKRPVSLADVKERLFPDGAETLSRVFRYRTSFDKHLVTVLASFSGNGRVEDYVLYLLKGLREISDYIVIVCDNPIFSEEAVKLEAVCDACICERHCEYDFGSYKRGIAFFEEQGIFTAEDELLVLNDSNYGPVNSLAPVLEKFHESGKDFYGLTFNIDYIQSYFYLFKRKVYTSGVFREFFRNIWKELSGANVVFRYECKLTEILTAAGFTWLTLVPLKRASITLTGYWSTLFDKFSFPFVKIKALQGLPEDDVKLILGNVKQKNCKLYDVIIPHLTARRATVKHKEVPRIDAVTLRERYSGQVSRLHEKCHAGGKLKTVFLVSMSGMFPGEELMKGMLEDDLFEVELYVIPDTRFGKKEMYRLLEESYKELSAKYPFTKVAVDRREDGEIIKYHDVAEGADLICYPSPYDVSYSLYNPYYAVAKNILSLHVDYLFPVFKYARFIYQLHNYNNFWKVFMETKANYEEYRKYGRCEAYNAEVTGYSKMDKLSVYVRQEDGASRRKIIIAPHHSVDGGHNQSLLLSNFYKYSELFLKLPEDYPEIDFVFSPHPVLFIAMRQEDQWGEERCNEYIEKLKSMPNMEYRDKGDYLELFSQSDGMIQDCGSFLAEYFYTGRPCCYMLKKESDIKEKFFGLGQECLANCYIAYEETDIRRFLDEVITEGKDPKKERLEKFRREVIMVNYPNVTEIILKNLKEEFSSSSS